MSELSVVDAPASTSTSKKVPLPNPFYKPAEVNQKAGMKQDRMALGECELVVHRPETLTQAIYEDLESMFELVLRTAKRAVQSSESK